ncbi:MAG: hypothetical protein WBF06_15485 [Candidatus Acidiferrales bacterium]
MIALAHTDVGVERETQLDERVEKQFPEYVREQADSGEIDSRFGAQAAAHDLQQRARKDAQSENRARRWMWGFLFALGALQIYYVQAMLAALFLFTLAFAVFAVIALAFYAANRVSQATLVQVRPIVRVAERGGRRTLELMEHVSRKTFRRPHSETAQ